MNLFKPFKAALRWLIGVEKHDILTPFERKLFGGADTAMTLCFECRHYFHDKTGKTHETTHQCLVFPPQTRREPIGGNIVFTGPHGARCKPCADINDGDCRFYAKQQSSSFSECTCEDFAECTLCDVSTESTKEP